MKKYSLKSGFSTVELLITLFIAASFLMSGYQLYSVIIKSGSETRAKIRASNAINDYLERYKSSATNPCTAQTPVSNEPITVATLSDVTVSVTISCPYSSTTSLSKIFVTLSYNQPQQTISNATYVDNSVGIVGESEPTPPDPPESPGPNWIPGITATAMAGKFVYNADIGWTPQYHIYDTGVSSPQGATGLDPNYPSHMSLVSPQTNPTVDFTDYPAQNACKGIGGRLPYTDEMLAIYADRASYGNNFSIWYYFTSTEYNVPNAYGVNFSGGSLDGIYARAQNYVRCVNG